MTEIQVDELFPWPELIQTPGVGWHPGLDLILICDPGLTAADSAAFAGAKLTLVGYGPIIALLIDAAGFTAELLSTHMLGSDLPSWATTAEVGRATFRLVLVDHTTGRVAGIRVFTVSPAFTSTLRREIQHRWSEPLNEIALMNAVTEFRRRYPTDKEMRRASTMSTRMGG